MPKTRKEAVVKFVKFVYTVPRADPEYVIMPVEPETRNLALYNELAAEARCDFPEITDAEIHCFEAGVGGIRFYASGPLHEAYRR